MTDKILLIAVISIYFISALVIFLQKKNIKKTFSIEELKQKIKVRKKYIIFMFILSCGLTFNFLRSDTIDSIISVITYILVGFVIMSYPVMYSFMLKYCLKEKEKEQEYELKNHTQNRKIWQ